MDNVKGVDSVIFLISSAVCISILNILFGRTKEKPFFITIQLCFASLSSLLVSYYYGNFEVNYYVIAVYGVGSGLCMGAMFICIREALEYSCVEGEVNGGLQILTFSILNTACVVPGMYIFLFRNKGNAYVFNMAIFIGIIVILVAIYFECRTTLNKKFPKKWFLFAFLSFLFHSFLACLLRDLGISSQYSKCLFLPFVFLTALVANLIYHRSEIKFNRNTMYEGLTGGMLDGFALFLLFLACTYTGTDLNHVIFPIYAIGIIFFTAILTKIFHGGSISVVRFCLFLLGIAMCIPSKV